MRPSNHREPAAVLLGEVLGGCVPQDVDPDKMEVRLTFGGATATVKCAKFEGEREHNDCGHIQSCIERFVREEVSPSTIAAGLDMEVNQVLQFVRVIQGSNLLAVKENFMLFLTADDAMSGSICLTLSSRNGKNVAQDVITAESFGIDGVFRGTLKCKQPVGGDICEIDIVLRTFRLMPRPIHVPPISPEDVGA